MNHLATYESRTQALIEALPYIQRFRGQTFVIKYGGSAMEDDAIVESLLMDIVFLEAVGINPVLVHGGGKAITKRLEALDIPSQFVRGLRVTDADTIGVVEEILDRSVNPRIVQTLTSFGGRAHGIPGATVFHAKRLKPVRTPEGETLDWGFVGEVESVDITPIEADIAAETVSVVSPLARDTRGQILNVNADTAASSIACALKASKIIYLSDVPGILKIPTDPGTLISTVDRHLCDSLKADGTLSGGMLPKVESAFTAIDSGVEKVHFIDGRIPHGLLLEVFTDAGVGTQILA